MPDVGVLELSIKDNAGKAGEGLQSLVGALLSVKTAVEGGLQLSSVGKTIEEIATIVNKNISKTTITKLNDFMAGLSGLKNLGEINININTSKVADVKDSVDRVTDSSEKVKDSLSGVSSGLVESLEEGMTRLDLLREKVGILRSELNAGIDKNSFSDKKVINYTLQIMKLEEEIENLENVAAREAQAEYYSDFAESFSTLEAYGMKLNALWSKLQEGIQSGTFDDEKIANYMLRINQLRDRIASLKEEVSGGAMRILDDEALEAANNFMNVNDQASYLKMQIEALQKELGRGIISGDADETKLSRLAQRITKLQAKYEKLTTAANESKDASSDFGTAENAIQDVEEAAENSIGSVERLNDAISNSNANGNDFASLGNGMQDVCDDISDTENRTEELTSSMQTQVTKLDLLKAKLKDAEDQYQKFSSELGSSSSKAISAALNIEKLKNEIADIETNSTGIGKITSAFSSMKEKIKSIFPTLTSLASRFASIAVNRALRYAIRELASAVSEGVENVYWYSKAVGTDFAGSMDDAATSVNQLKNSIGASLTPVISSLVPYLQTVCSWLITGINYLNQFFALLNGQSTWTKALATATDAYTDSTKTASDATNDLLADWDELNIIQSTNSGSSSGTTATDYSEMFEEVSEYEGWIKDIVEDIENSFNSIWELAGLIGAAILGWKISSAFSGVLSQLGSIVAGTAMLIIGLKLSYGSAFSAGESGEWSTSDILGTIGGIIASAIGGYYIGSAFGVSGIGIAIGLTVGVVAALKGYIDGQNLKEDKDKWGVLNLTQEEIETLVKEQFTFDVEAEIDVIGTNMTITSDALKKFSTDVSTFKKLLGVASSIEVDADTTKAADKITAIKEAAASAQETIESLQALIDANEDGLTYTLTNFSFQNENGEDISDKLLASIKIADQTLKDYFTGQGKELAQWIYEGEKTGWKNGEAEMALELMASQQRIYDKADELNDQMSFEVTTSAELKNVVDRDSAIAIWNQQKEEFDEYTKTVEESVKSEADQLIYLASLAEAASQEVYSQGGDGAELHNASQQYLADAQAILDDVEGAVERKLADTKATMAKQWAETLQVVYGSDYETLADFFSQDPSFYNDDFFRFGPLNSYFNEENFDKAGIIETAEALKEYFISTLTSSENDYNGLVSYYLNDLGGNVFDLLTEEAKNSIMSQLVSVTGDVSIAQEIFQNAFGLTWDDAEKYAEPFFEGTKEAVKEGVENTSEYIENAVENDDKTYTYEPNVNIKPEVEQDVDIWDLMDTSEKDVDIWDLLNSSEANDELEGTASWLKQIFDYLREIGEIDNPFFSMEDVDIDSLDWGGTSGRVNAGTVTGSAGYSDIGNYNTSGVVIQKYTGSNANGGNTKVQVTDTDLATSINNSNSEQTAAMVSHLRTIETRLQSLLNKNWTVTLGTSTAAGFWSGINKTLVNTVTGN